jgi:TolB protein
MKKKSQHPLHRNTKARKTPGFAWIMFICLPLLVLTGVNLSHAAYDYINISNPFLKKIPMAVPIFKSMTSTAAEADTAMRTSDLMVGTLEFTGYFTMIDREAFIDKPEDAGIDRTRINFANWTAIGAELLITGGLRVEGGNLEIEFRLFDTFKADLLFGKRYTGRVGDEREMVRRFCGEVIYRLTGRQGLFDSKIAFVSTTTSGNKEVYRCDFDGNNPVRVTHANTLILSPAWLPDGSGRAIVSYERGKPDIFVQLFNGKRESVSTRDGINITPAWVPKTSYFAATLSFEGDEEIYLLTRSGEIVKRLTKNWGIDVSPTLSPDGKRMAFVSKRSGTPQIHILDVADGNVYRVTYDGRYNTQPAWSPAGDRIAYSGMEDGQINIYVIGADGRGNVQLTRNAGNNESPSWSPDGNMIAFSSTRTGKSRIFVMTASGTEQRQLLELPGEQTSPAWSPRLSGS